MGGERAVGAVEHRGLGPGKGDSARDYPDAVLWAK